MELLQRCIEGKVFWDSVDVRYDFYVRYGEEG
jgi:hypothetical protein